MSDDDDQWDRVADEVAWDDQHGIPTTGSVAVQLQAVRQLLAECRARETELENWARSGDFKLSVPGDPCRIVVAPTGAVLIVTGD